MAYDSLGAIDSTEQRLEEMESFLYRSVSRLALGVPRYLERLIGRLEAEGRLGDEAMTRVYEDLALLAQTFSRFVGDRARQDQPGIEMAAFHLRKILHRSLLELLRRRVSPEYIEDYVAGNVDPFDPADDLSETGFFYDRPCGSPLGSEAAPGSG